MKIAFMGTPDFAVTSLCKLIEKGYQVEMVVTQPDRPRGRGKKVQPPPVKLLAQEHGISIAQPESVKDKGFIEELRDINPDVIVVVAFGQILPEEILNLPPLGCVNVHASLLPKYRGAAPINWSIINGERFTGITTMYMDKGMDTGDMVYQQRIEIGPEETAGQLHDRLAALGAEVLVKTLEDIIKGTAPRIPQNHSQATYAPQLSRDDGRVDWNQPAEKIYNLIRGTDPWPGCFTFYEGIRMKIWKAKVLNIDSVGQAGTIINISSDGLTVKAGKGQIAIQEIQMPSSRRMTVEEYIRGNSLLPGKILGDNGVD